MPHPDDPLHASDLTPDDISWTDSLVIRPSTIHGIGVFARRRFEAGDIIERVPLVAFPDDQMHFARMPGTMMHRYAMPGSPDPDHSSWMGGYGTFYNHQPDPALFNARWSNLNERTLVFIAVRDIEPGDEITFDYGDDPGF